VGSIHRAIQAAGGTIDRKILPIAANKIYAEAGGKSNEAESLFTTGYVCQTLVIFGLGQIKDGILTVKKQEG